MRQEHRFCAEVYHRLHDQIDQKRRVLCCSVWMGLLHERRRNPEK